MFSPSPCPFHYERHLAIMASADSLMRSDSVSLLQRLGSKLQHLSSCRISSRSPQIRTLTFVRLAPHLPCLVITRHRHLVLTRLKAKPCMRFLFIATLLCSFLPSDHPLRNRPWNLLAVLIYSVKSIRWFSRRDFHPLVNAHAGRTRVVPPWRAWSAG